MLDIKFIQFLDKKFKKTLSQYIEKYKSKYPKLGFNDTIIAFHAKYNDDIKGKYVLIYL